MASGKMAENDPAASDDAERADQISTLLKLVRQNLAGVESWLTMDQSGWEEINGLFDADGPIAKCLQHLPKFSGHNALSVGEALAALKHRFLGYIVQISESDKFREICDELGAVRRETADLAANIRARKLIGRILDLDPVLSALDEFARLVEVRRKQWGSKRTAREFVREAIMIVEIYIGARVGIGSKRGTPADGVRQIIGIMDPSIGSGTIDEALKARSKETNKRE